ncbi:hypothetical protein KQ940_13265 [Marinobacterium sp. D7]|uniref:hypothetical protein n=1 Tax=Marinobacterium ramblicola TaxID=2849041 RepID=UPI001C2D406C|nr:hypothetical protein [Marinobacterium ramblicola]MBV1789021.1 hypothetical protein [Marinobacterium ramblicola]
MNMGNEYEIETIGDWNPELRFELDEAVSLFHKEVIRIEDRAHLPKPPIEMIGIVCGVLTLNDEIEVIVRFSDGLEQLCKTEFCGDFILVEKACLDG